MSDERPGYGTSKPPANAANAWQPAQIRALRQHVGETQAEFAARIGTRQQTVSEWETGASRPRSMARRLLQLVADERAFYRAGAADRQQDASALVP